MCTLYFSYTLHVLSVNSIHCVLALYLRFSQSGPRVVFELKKELTSAAHYQAMVTLLLANYFSSRYVHRVFMLMLAAPACVARQWL